MRRCHTEVRNTALQAKIQHPAKLQSFSYPVAEYQIEQPSLRVRFMSVKPELLKQIRAAVACSPEC